MAGQDAQLINQLKKKRLVLFAYKCTKSNGYIIHRKLHGRVDVFSSHGGGTQGTLQTSEERGRTIKHKEYHYPGIPHYDITRGVFLVEQKVGHELTAFFEKNKIPFVEGVFRLTADTANMLAKNPL